MSIWQVWLAGGDLDTKESLSSPSHTQRSKREKQESGCLGTMRRQLERHLARRDNYCRRRERERQRDEERDNQTEGEILSRSCLYPLWLSSFLSFPSSFCYLRWPCMSDGERGPGSTTTTIFDQVSPKTEEDCGESRQDSTVGSQVTAAIFQRIIPQACISRTRAREESRHQYSPSHGKNYKNIGE